MSKKWFCVFISVLVISLMFSGCSTTKVVTIQKYMPKNMKIIENDIREKDSKRPKPANTREVLLHIDGGPMAGGIGTMEGTGVWVFKAVDLGNGGKKEQRKYIETRAKDKKSRVFLIEDYSTALSILLEKQLGRYYGRVRVERGASKAVPDNIGIKSLVDYERRINSKSATVTIRATLPGGVPLTATGTQKVKHANVAAFIPLMILMPIIGHLIASSMEDRNEAKAVLLAMNDACEKLAAQISQRVAALGEGVIEIQVAITGIRSE